MVNVLNDCPKVSFIIVNYNGIVCLKDCFDSIMNLNYPQEKIECILVDNGSVDGSIQFINKEYRNVRVIKNDSNEGFAKPNNDGAKIASGEYLALINNDMKLEKNWLMDMIESLTKVEDENYVCVGSKILNWDGSKLDYVGGSISFYGHGFQFDYGLNAEEGNKKYNKDQDILFPCGGAMLIDKNTFLEVGGFDEDYFAYNEDVDLGWRLWILGHKVRFCSKAVCYHKHSVTSNKMNKNIKDELNSRNSLYTIYKNYDDEKIYKVLFSALSIKMYRTNDDDTVQLDSVKDFIDNLHKMKAKRDWVQKQRKVDDKVIVDKFFKKPYDNQMLKYNFKNNLYNNIIEQLISSTELDNIFGKKKSKVLVISSGSIGEKMAGPGIRYLEISKELSKICNVSLAVPNDDCNLNLEDYNIEYFHYSGSNYDKIKDEFLTSDIVIVQGIIFELLPILKSLCDDRIVIVDLYDPIVIEDLEINKKKDIKTREVIHNSSLNLLKDQIKIGDYFVCASEKQKDFWSGMLVSANKINPREYDLSNTLKKLIGLLPFGISNEDPVHNREVLKDKISNFKENDKVFIWGGGVWNWFDPLTLIRAIGKISRYRDDIKLFFMGVKHPNPDVPEMEMLNAAVNLAEELGIRDKNVFFNMDWVDYNDRQNFLMEAYAGVSSHFDNLETRFSFRTRILDYFWAELPIIATEGDYFANEVIDKKLGLIVKYEDVDGMEQALIRICDDKQYYEECKNNIKLYREQLKWKNVTKDLKAFCLEPIKKTIESRRMYSSILDICQLESDGVIEPICFDKSVKQEFKCRYPNLNRVEVKFGTYNRINYGTLLFQLHDKLTGVVIFEQKVSIASLEDCKWHLIEFSPIINSEGREFYFEISTFEDVQISNSVALFYKKAYNRYGNLYYDEGKVDGNLAFKTSCMLTNKTLDDKDGIMLYDEKCIGSILNNMNGITELDRNRLLKYIEVTQENKDNMQKQSTEELTKSITKISEELRKFDKWQRVIDSRFDRLKKLNFVALIKRAFKNKSNEVVKE
ncbi:Glycosyltransferase, GT2 family [Clostridium acidisoli DSM 12555]|uniref:Glycosyltransferase, GT2 family n=1 Tax=Clostridium acidisoli DSM 12555 TaxID=1121291 RepID=A0A1W1XAP3_9CLOT|nr:Glycosyltransferase, GT2 family [Clostridium acidisoli DSM 12555]